MPFKIKKIKKGYKVAHGSHVFGVHKSKAAARRQQKAIYANYKKK